MKPDRPTTSSSTPKISKRELRRRVAAFKARGGCKIAGPDHPIDKGGLQVASIRFMQAPPSQDDEKCRSDGMFYNDS
jgi:hypothetical protein